MNDYEFVKEIGRGSFGCAILGRHKTSQEYLVIKKICCDKLSRKQLRDARKEVQVFITISTSLNMLKIIIARKGGIYKEFFMKRNKNEASEYLSNRIFPLQSHFGENRRYNKNKSNFDTFLHKFP